MLKNLEEVKKELKTAFLDKVESAFVLLSTSLKEGTENYDTFMLLFVEHKQLKKAIQQGTLPEYGNDSEKVRNRINSRVLSLINDLSEEDLKGVGDEKENNNENDLDTYILELKKLYPDRAIAANSIISDLIQSCEIREGFPLSVMLGYTSVDKALSGLAEDSLTVISCIDEEVCRAFILNLILKGWEVLNRKAFYLSLHHRSLTLIDKLISIFLKKDKPYLKRMGLEEYEWQELHDASKKLEELPMHLVDSISTLKDIESTIFGKLLEDSVDLIIIDNLQFLNGPVEKNDVYKELKGLAKRFNKPIVLLNKLNNTDNRFNDIVLSKLDDCIYIDNLLTIDVPRIRGEYEDGIGNSLMDVAYIIIEKSEKGNTDSVKFFFDLNTKVFEEEESESVRERVNRVLKNT